MGASKLRELVRLRSISDKHFLSFENDRVVSHPTLSLTGVVVLLRERSFVWENQLRKKKTIGEKKIGNKINISSKSFIKLVNKYYWKSFMKLFVKKESYFKKSKQSFKQKL
jgi:hypothetical protein